MYIRSRDVIELDALKLRVIMTMDRCLALSIETPNNLTETKGV